MVVNKALPIHTVGVSGDGFNYMPGIKDLLCIAASCMRATGLITVAVSKNGVTGFGFYLVRKDA